MSTHPEPLLLPSHATDSDIRELIAKRFGTGATIIGVTAPFQHHAGIHQGGLSVPGMTNCGTASHGRLHLITQVLAATDSPDAERVVRLLRGAGIAPCRMCRRCWPNAALPEHDRVRCFSVAARRIAENRQ
ncbi:hypothetical protein [Amycolatopsis sp. TNS106]|uniref:hypothetical protein n=1 Tax=Amycolatopsis sp. TNS106 TaxID=2861750 RepID=UPI001C5602E6|nr:hypothetical protein [Amycolatopsis sp. TNS106]QXV57398.1 hypothetical protein CVV72_10600 [Amycolatopsis sp. TNS106]